jgi:hypothetical protein
MSSIGEKYVRKLYQQLRQLPEEEREDAVMEIKSHIAESVRNGQKEEEVLEKLGSPSKLARAYLGDFYVRESRMHPLFLIRALLLYVTSGFLSIIFIPVLGILSVTFGVVSIIIPILGLLRTFGATPTYEVPVLLSFPFSLLVALILFGLFWICRKALRGYLTFLSSAHRKVISSSHVR